MMLAQFLAALLTIPEMTPPYVARDALCDRSEMVRVAPVLRADGVIAGAKTLRANDHEGFVTLTVGGRTMFSVNGRFNPSPRYQLFHFFKGGLNADGSQLVRTAYPFAIVDDTHSRGTFTTTMDRPSGDRVRLGFHADIGTNDLSGVKYGEVLEFVIAKNVDFRIVADGQAVDLEGLKKVRGVKRAEFHDRETDAFLFALEPDPQTVAGFGGWKHRLRVFPRRGPCTPLFVTVDLGATWMPRTAPKLVAGIDFWAENEYRVAQYPTRNILMNPGFASGMRYWKSAPSVDPESMLAEAEGLPAELPRGHRAVRLTHELMSVGLVLKPSTDYTFSLWLKSDNPAQKATLEATLGGVQGNARVAGCIRLAASGAGWTRCSGRFRTTYDQVDSFLRLSPWRQKGRIAGLQFEEGTNVTAYCGNPLGLELVTDSPQRFYGDARKPVNARLVVRGPAGTKGTIACAGQDLYRRSVVRDKRKFQIGADGTATVPLCKDADLKRGPNVFRVKVRTNFGTFEDHLRFTLISCRDGRDPLRMMQGTSQYSFDLPNVKMPAYELERLRDFGIGGINYPGNPTGGPDERFTPEDRANLARLGLEDTWGGLCWSSHGQTELDGKPLPKWVADQSRNAETYSDEFLRYWEEGAYREAKRNPLQTVWSFDSEPCEHYASLKKQNWREYAKWMLAINRGLKRANPKNVFTPFGSWNMFKGGSDSIYEFLVASTAEDPKTRWERMEVHTYRELPGHPDLERDLLYLFQAMAAAGYPDISLKIGEGSYYHPMWRPSMNFYAWSGVAAKDGYANIAALGYDLGWGERIGAALVLRETLVYLKYRDRITSNCSWCPPQIDNYQTFAWYSAHNALMELLGDGRWIEDVRFSRDGRAMLFDDGKGSVVAAVWNDSARYDMGREAGVWCLVPGAWCLEPGALEIFDLMGNGCEVKVEGEGEQRRIKLPLNGFVMYLRVKKERCGELAKALKGAVTPGVEAREKKVFVDTAKSVGIVKAVTGDAVRGVFPDWTKVPARTLGSVANDAKGASAAKGATCRAAWNERGFYVRVEVAGKRLCVPAESERAGWRDRAKWDSVKLCFDGFANAREKLSEGFKGMDFDDFVYCLYPTNASAAVCWRRRAPDHQLTGGAGFGLLPEVVEPLVKTSFAAQGGGLVYEAAFPPRTMMPVALKAGTEFGLAVEVTDRASVDRPAARMFSSIGTIWWMGPEHYERMKLEEK